MKFENEIAVEAPADELFAFLADVERVAPCLPGASIDQRDGDDYRGSMKVKVGPISGTYQGSMRFVELDRERRRAVLTARADEAHGNGNAEARIETSVAEQDGRSRVRLITDLQLRGRVAQFGRGAIERLAERLFSEFAHNVERQMSGAGEAEAQAESGAEGEGSESSSPDAEQRAPARPAGKDEGPALDALGLVGGPMVGKIVPVLLPALIGFGYGYLLGRLRELTR